MSESICKFGKLRQFTSNFWASISTSVNSSTKLVVPKGGWALESPGELLRNLDAHVACQTN